MDNEQDLMRKIQGLLKKAEGTDNEHEAKAFFEKAYDLMTRHAIDEERVRQADIASGKPADPPVYEDYMFSSYAHHKEAKAHLISSLCLTHHVKYIEYGNQKDSNLTREGNGGLHESQWCRVVGFKSDIERVKMLYLSLLIQSQRFANEDWRDQYGEKKNTGDEWAKKGDWDYGEGKFSWISGHMLGFASRVYERFKELENDIKAETNSTALMINKDLDVDKFWAKTTGQKCYEFDRTLEAYCIKPKYHDDPHAFTYQIPRSNVTFKAKRSYYVAKGRRTAYDSGGYGSGRRAGDRADLGQTRTTSGSKALKEG